MGLRLITSDVAFDMSALLPVRWNESETEACLRAFVAGQDTFIRFTLDAPGKLSMARAIAKVAGIGRDKTVSYTQVAVKSNGKVTWKRLKKSESAGNRETRTAEIRSYSREAMREGEEEFRKSTGIVWRIDTLVSSPTPGETVYCLAREATVS